MTSYRICLS